MKSIKTILCIIFLTSTIVFFQSCMMFMSPEGQAQIISKYTKDSGENHLLYAVVQITNTGNKTIYQSTISLKAETNLHSYYKTTTSNISVNPGKSVFVTVEFSFTDEETNLHEKDDSSENIEDVDDSKKESESEKWNESSVCIIDVFWN